MRTPADAVATAHVFVASLADRCVIDGADGHHLQRVRRVRAGERVTAADGTGDWREYDVVDASGGALTLDACSQRWHEPEPAVGVALAVALTKSGLDDVVAAATELGAVAITPVRTARTVVRWDAARADRARVRLAGVAREAAMQSRRTRVPVIEPVAALTELVGTPGLVVAERDGTDPGRLAVPAAGRWTVLVGPEGGFDDAERAVLAGVPHLALGKNVLRAATAPIAAVAVLAARIGAGDRGQPLRPE